MIHSTCAVDNDVIVDQPIHAFVTGNYNKVPFMLGNVEDEGTIFIYEAFPKPLPLAGYKAVRPMSMHHNCHVCGLRRTPDSRSACCLLVCS